MDPLIERHLADIHRIAAQHGVTRIRLVGSRARGDARPDSDLDLLVDMEPQRSLLDLIAFQQDLEAFLGVRVDAGQRLSRHVESLVLQDAIEL